MENKLKVLDYKEFFQKYNKSAKDSRFTGKAYSETGNNVVIYMNDLRFDCYFQCPNYGETVVPEDRRYIYLLKAGEHNNIKYSLSPDATGKERISVKLEDLEVFADPYSPDLDLGVKPLKEDKTDWLIGELKKVIERYEERYNK